MYIVKGTMRPAIVCWGHITYAMSGGNWVQVPTGTTLDQIEWIDTKPAYIPKKVEVATREVFSSRGDKTYWVSVQNDGKKECTCSGFMYRRRCRHTDELQEEKGWK